ncbi:hypothetical protein CAL29_19090 [Bordetella genomosp. 10]|uniref:Uncharacterized protein n=1 Tax=Bordetella genomosp. 10 TaxID=1416804 RepID=A0A261RZJ3_9BORD|nr:hypothetical protein CAL29_19090 [Bordetella genomosp. 10]
MSSVCVSSTRCRSSMNRPSALAPRQSGRS